MSKVFDRGDIVRVCLNPVAGRELQGELRPALVLTPKAFNRLGITWVAPITQGGDYSRYAGFAVTLMGAGTQTQGVALVNMLRGVDLPARGAKLVERVPDVVLDDAMARLQAILEN